MFCEEDKNIPLNDKSIKVVYNASAFDEEKNENIKAFLKFIHNHTVENNLTNKISNLVYKIKQNEANKTEYTTMNPRERDIFLVKYVDALREKYPEHKKKQLIPQKIY